MVNFKNHPTSKPMAEAVSELGNYTAKIGDTVFSIAGKYGVSIAALKGINAIEGETVTPGQVLTIPDAPSGDWYTVEKGDSLYSIATKYNVAIPTVQKLNVLRGDLIMPGQVLIVPQAKIEAASSVKVEKPPVLKKQPNIVMKSKTNTLAEIFRQKGISQPQSRMAIFVDKSAHTLSLYMGGSWLKSYPMELGDGGLGDKQVQGDHKTPEGSFYVAEKSVLRPADKFLGSRWLRISYPNLEDGERGIRQGLIDQGTCDAIKRAWEKKTIPPQYTALGGGVGIHGGNSKEQGSNWTWGCIGLRDQDIEDFFDYIKVGTPIFIQQ
jgi:LysM repeat protein